MIGELQYEMLWKWSSNGKYTRLQINSIMTYKHYPEWCVNDDWGKVYYYWMFNFVCNKIPLLTLMLYITYLTDPLNS